jgi:hypothetical protein
VPEEIRAEFLAALGDLLDRAQRAGTTRADLDVTDLLDLVIGFAAATRRAHDRGRADRIVAIAGHRAARQRIVRVPASASSSASTPSGTLA